MKIHPQAVVSPQADIGRDVVIGPYCVVEDHVRIGDGCVLENSVVIKRHTTLGPRNHVFDGAILGGIPQHARITDEPGELVIGAGNTIREHATIHRALHAGTATRVGDNNFLMINVHIAHDCAIGDATIMANNVMLAGHVTVEDRAYLSGATAVHQFCRIGTLAMVGGQAHLVKDVPPYVVVDGLSSRVVGLNRVGLRRNGFTAEEMSQLKEAYRVLYRGTASWQETLAELERCFPSGPAARFHTFCQEARRGIVQERRGAATPTLRLLDDVPDEAIAHRKAG